MTDAIPFQTIPAEERAEMLRRHLIGFVGYALGQAYQRGLTADEAARSWLERLMAGIPESNHAAGVDEIGAWAERNAAAMEMHHGRVELQSRGDSWRMVVDLSEDRDSLTGWDAPLEYFAGWVAAQTGTIADRRQFRAEVWLEGTMLYLELAPFSEV